MGITNSNKVINADRIDCDGSLKVTLALTAAPDIISTPTDIALVLDRSGSMTGTPLTNMKTGAKTFIDIISQSTGGQSSGEIGSGSHIGIVSFADTAQQNTQLITSVSTLKNAVDSLSAGGSTNHADAFSKAIALFDPSSSNDKVIVMFTDGKTTAGFPLDPARLPGTSKTPLPEPDRVLFSAGTQKKSPSRTGTAGGLKLPGWAVPIILSRVPGHGCSGSDPPGPCPDGPASPAPPGRHPGPGWRS